MKNYWILKRVLPNTKNQEVVNDFLLSMKQSNKSPRTIMEYNRFLEKFFEEIEDGFDSLTSDQILKWLQANISHLKEKTYSNYLSILSSFYTFCKTLSLIERSPIKSRWFPRLPKSVPKSLDKDEIAKIRKASESSTLRDQLLFEFMLSSGCRVGEIHLLNLKDVDLENRTALVIGKGRKIRHIHFSEKCAVLLERYLETRIEKKDSALFLTYYASRRLSIEGIQVALKKLGKKAGLSKPLHPHMLRHTFATLLLSKGAQLSFISDELGHKDLVTTQIYARLPKQAIVAQYRKFMG